MIRLTSYEQSGWTAANVEISGATVERLLQPFAVLLDVSLRHFERVALLFRVGWVDNLDVIRHQRGKIPCFCLNVTWRSVKPKGAPIHACDRT